MSSREIIKSAQVNLSQNDKGQYIVSKVGTYPYAIREGSRIYDIVRIFDSRCLASQRRYDCANEVISILSHKLEAIEHSKIYKFFHYLGVL